MVSFAKGYVSEVEILQMALCPQTWEILKHLGMGCGNGSRRTSLFYVGLKFWPSSALERSLNSEQPLAL
jgi:hypothetical protein